VIWQPLSPGGGDFPKPESDSCEVGGGELQTDKASHWRVVGGALQTDKASSCQQANFDDQAAVHRQN